MAIQKQNKKDSNLTNLFAETLVKKQDPTHELGSDPRGGSGDRKVDEDANPVTKAFMEQLFGELREDLAALRQELATTVKELKGEVTELGQRVYTVERTCEAGGGTGPPKEIIALQDSNRDLQYRLEDLENRSQRTNIRIRGILAQAIVGPLEDFVIYINGPAITVPCIYGPTEHREEFLREAIGWVLATTDADILIGGDFNLGPDTNVDKSAKWTGGGVLCGVP
ncbi:hypothetical protein NDU88_002087 [Pleurodeles waltl]|uniref:Endonuclease/exonuclease/phosphatase domain-containing protein n=1 Tax=Pleurodeles waltl TaxID=8319 RepID=A0AAV7LZW9_PLEWA|nr:hypothetical protein NDU88_002087 [Pleurodeles waltl]